MTTTIASMNSIPRVPPDYRNPKSSKILLLVAGLLLTFSSLMKLGVVFDLLTKTSLRTIESEYLFIGEAVLELALGTSLLTPFRRGVWNIRSALLVSAAIFLAFTGYTFHKVLIGEKDCGCFGSLRSPPILTLIIDGSLSILLLTNLRRNKTAVNPIIALPIICLGFLVSAGLPSTKTNCVRPISDVMGQTVNRNYYGQHLFVYDPTCNRCRWIHRKHLLADEGLLTYQQIATAMQESTIWQAGCELHGKGVYRIDVDSTGRIVSILSIPDDSLGDEGT